MLQYFTFFFNFNSSSDQFLSIQIVESLDKSFKNPREYRVLI